MALPCAPTITWPVCQHPEALCQGRSSEAFSPGAALAADTGDVSVLQSSSRQAVSCSAWHAVFLNTHVCLTTSKPEKFLVRGTPPAAPGVPQRATATGWEKRWWKDHPHEAI